MVCRVACRGLNDMDTGTEGTLRTLRELVGINTQVPPGDNYGEAVNYTESRFSELGLRTERITMPRDVFLSKNPNLPPEKYYGERVNLLASLDAGADRTMVINTHLDVVPAGNGWSVPPFEGIVRDGKFYGRGASDSKAGIACLITVLARIIESGKAPGYNLVIALTTDEEVGPYSGLCYLADKGVLKGDVFLSMDGSSDDITIAANGSINWKLTVHGKSYHSGYSFMGVNAIEKSVPVMNEILSLKSRIGRRVSNVRMSTVAGEKMGIRNMKPVLNISVISGGVKDNIVPDTCVMIGDRRVTPEEDAGEACRELREAVESTKEKDPALRCELACNLIYPPLYTPPEHPWVREVQEAAASAFGTIVETSGTQGSLDVAYAARVTGMPACAFGVGRRVESGAHAPDENVRLEDIGMYNRFLHILLMRRGDERAND